MRLRRVAVTVVGALVASTLIAGITPPATAAKGHPIVIALEAPLSGAQSANGQDMLRGAQLAAMQINAAGGVAGRSLRIIGIDDKANPGQARSAVRQASRAGAVAVVGPFNSSVGVRNLPLYVENKIFPMRMTSAVSTQGFGATTQPMETQIAPVEVAAMVATGATSVAMLVDPSTYTATIAAQTRAGLTANGITVTQISITEGESSYQTQISEALATNPDIVYSSTYYPEGSVIARELAEVNTDASCFMGMANVDPEFIREAGVTASRNCTFIGVPAAPQLPTAKKYTASYEREFRRQPGVWGAFTYDSVFVLADAMKRSSSMNYAQIRKAVFATTSLRGATGVIAFEPGTGNRVKVPISVLQVSPRGVFVVAR